MAFRKLKIGGLEVACQASTNGATMSVSFGGAWWQRMAARRSRHRASVLALAPVTPAAVRSDSVQGMNPNSSTSIAASALRSEISNTIWYHTLELGNGVVTPGQFDHRDILPLYRLPDSLAGKRVLDVATFDGFWAFEFERRGAREVVALDLDKPSQLDLPPKRVAAATREELDTRFGTGFAIAKTALGSRVERVGCSVYDLTPERYGMFDIVHAGDFLIHLNSPVRALQRIASVTSDYALISDVVFPELDRVGDGALLEYMGGSSDVTWWKFGVVTLGRMILDAGFRQVEKIAQFQYGPRGLPRALTHVVFKASK